MGNSSSAEKAKEVETSSGFHILEVHGGSIIGFLVCVMILGALAVCGFHLYRRRSMRNKLQHAILPYNAHYHAPGYQPPMLQPPAPPSGAHVQPIPYGPHTFEDGTVIIRTNLTQLSEMARLQPTRRPANSAFQDSTRETSGARPSAKATDTASPWSQAV